MKGFPKNYPTWNKPALYFSQINKLKGTYYPTFKSQSPPLGSFFKFIFNFSMLNKSMDLTQLLCIFVLPINTTLGPHNEEKSHLLTP